MHIKTFIKDFVQNTKSYIEKYEQYKDLTGEEKKARKPRKAEKVTPEEETEWSEDVANNPFAALLKNIDVDAE